VYLPHVELHEADSLEEASALMARHGREARLLAGGTDLIVDLKSSRVQARHLVSIGGIGALHGVTTDEFGLRIGALTTISQLGAAPAVRQSFASLLDATQQMAAPQVRNLATVGGNLASAVPCADLPPILIALKARVVIWSAAGSRETPLEAFFLGPRRTTLAAGDVLTAVRVPHPPSRFGAAYARFALRDGNAIAVTAVAASLALADNGLIHEARIALGAVAPIPVLCRTAGARLAGCSPEDAAFADAAEAAVQSAEPISDVRGSAEYRRELVGVLTGRALETALRRARLAPDE